MTRSYQKERIPCRGAAVTVLFLMLSLAGAAAGDMPDAVRTPGWVNPDVTQDNIGATVCKAGWTKTIRPRTKYTTDLKIRQIDEYGYSDKNPKNYEEIISSAFSSDAIRPMRAISGPSLTIRLAARALKMFSRRS